MLAEEAALLGSEQEISLQKFRWMPGVVVDASTWELRWEAHREFAARLGYISEFKFSLKYIARLRLKKQMKERMNERNEAISDNIH